MNVTYYQPDSATLSRHNQGIRLLCSTLIQLLLPKISPLLLFPLLFLFLLLLLPHSPWIKTSSTSLPLRRTQHMTFLSSSFPLPLPLSLSLSLSLSSSSLGGDQCRARHDSGDEGMRVIWGKGRSMQVLVVVVVVVVGCHDRDQCMTKSSLPPHTTTLQPEPHRRHYTPPPHSTLFLPSFSPFRNTSLPTT